MEITRTRKRQVGIAIMVVASAAYFAAGIYYRSLRFWLVVGWAIAFTFGKILKDLGSRTKMKRQKSL